jgi:uncharacterized protein DUF6152
MIESTPTGALSMKTKLLVLVAAVFAVLIVAGPTLAHHGTAAYEMKDMVTVKGTVTDFEFVNPHCQIYLDVKNEKGETEQWQGELTAPTKLARGGWTKHTLKAGDTVTVSGPVTKSGKHSIWIRNLIGPDGQPIRLSEE